MNLGGKIVLKNWFFVNDIFFASVYEIDIKTY